MLLAGPVSHTDIQYMEYMDFVEIFNFSLNLSAINFANFSGCRASFVYSRYPILQCNNLFSGVKLSIRMYKIVLFYFQEIMCFELHRSSRKIL